MRNRKVHSNTCQDCGKVFLSYRALIECYACGAAKHRHNHEESLREFEDANA